jgi:Predicted transcriptional regulators
MEYTVQKLAKLSGVTPRTLRYYDQIGLLHPCRISSNGYRIYNSQQLNRLQQILLYRELDLPLEEIAALLDAAGTDPLAVLEQHRQNLLAKRDRLDAVIATVEHTILEQEGGPPMSDQAKFEAFKQGLIDQNEKKYGKEIREKYGEATVDATNKKLQGMTPEQYARQQTLAQQIHTQLAAAFLSGDPAGAQAKELVRLHKDWLRLHWHSYSAEAHKNLAQMYVDDPRFSAYYDPEQSGKTAFLRDAIHLHADTVE